MEYYYLHSSELYHHGILGMKWGVRRYQNKDGSYTAEGKLRRAKNSNEDWYAPSSKAKTKKPSTTEKIKAAQSIVDTGRKGVASIESSRQKRNNPPRMDLSNMTDQELIKAINRENLELNYNRLFNKPTISKGEQYVDDILKVSGAMLAATGSALSIALAIQQLRGKK